MLALLLLALPSVLTRQKLLELLEFGERHHALAAVRKAALPPGAFSEIHPHMTVYRFLSLSIMFRSRVSSWLIRLPRLSAMLSSFLVASAGGRLFPLPSAKQPCGFWPIIR